MCISPFQDRNPTHNAALGQTREMRFPQPAIVQTGDHDELMKTEFLMYPVGKIHRLSCRALARCVVSHPFLGPACKSDKRDCQALVHFEKPVDYH